jgi:hypothetical protein
MTTDNLKAGPELDALVAEKVMGFTHAASTLGGCHWSCSICFPRHYSTAMEVAMDVADNFTTKTFYYDDATCTWFVGLDGGRKPHEQCKWQAAAEELPHAICLAAMAWANK